MVKKLLSVLIPVLFFSTAHAELPSTLTDREMQKFRQTSDGLVSINAVLAPGSTINTTGNITAGFFIGNGSLLTGVTGGNATANDTAYGASWNGSTTQMPSQNAVYDKIETIAGGNYTITNATTDTGWTHAAGKAYPTVIGDDIGIGLSDPVAPLTVKGDGNTTGKMVQLQSSTGVDRVTVLDNGNVGIGTTAPAGMLELNSAATNSSNLLVVLSPSLASTRSSSIGIGKSLTSGNSGYLSWVNNAVPYLSLETWGGVNPIRIWGNQTYIISNQVGIGTTAPSEKLDVQGNISVVSTSFYKGNASLMDGVGGDLSGTVGNAQIVAGTVGPSELAATAVTAGVYGSASLSPVITVDADGRVTNVTNATITGTGASTLWNSTGTNIYNNGSFTKVGIGTSAPNVNLVVVGDANITGNLTVSGNISYPGNVSAIYFEPYDQSIRGDTDAYALNITSDLIVSDGDIRITNGGQYFGDGGGIINVTGGTSQWDDGNGNTIGFIDGNASGAVGIGTTAAAYMLDIVGGAGEADIRIDGGDGQSVAFRFSENGTMKWLINYDGATNQTSIYSSLLDKHLLTFKETGAISLTPLTTIPTPAAKGDFYINGTNNVTYIYNGTAWRALY